ncbi:hypothetical protein E3N88_15982 [Mikania micrantha]|uniref:ACT domain-containing protein ACR n=1 Tax=Mikania micrantha TaxID=192012 RepID=A0A5N6NXJ8_9ASTR|nr:hypothetical protein E3N88_15982 [Mikania micrantha]
MMQMDRRSFPEEYEKLIVRLNTPRVMIDNAGCVDATLIMIDSARNDGILLEEVQVLTDLNLSIKKGYVSSDGRWNMDVFHVTNLDGNKLTDDSIINCDEKSLGTIHSTRSKSIDGMTTLELTGADRVGLLSEIFAVLSELNCDVVESKKGDNDIRSAKTSVSLAVTHTERRLHQMMFADRDYDRTPIIKTHGRYSPLISVQNYSEREYSVVNIQCKDRPRLLFDVVCTLTDMQYVVFHATINTRQDGAYLEFFIRHADGSPFRSEPEKQRVIMCLKAAVERRASEGAEISTTMGMALNIFYVMDVIGNPVDSKVVDSVMQRIGSAYLRVKELPLMYHQKASCDEQKTDGLGGAILFSLGSLLRRNLYNLGLIKL